MGHEFERERAARRRQAVEAEKAAIEKAREREAALQAALTKKRVPKETGTFFQVLRARAPRLLDGYSPALKSLAALPSLRPIEGWKPRGKGRESMYRSLAEYLLASYPVPAFLWSAFTEDDRTTFAPVVVQVAQGKSLYELVKTGVFPVPFTRRMCHDFLQTPGDVRFLTAIRRIEVRTSGGDARLLSAWMGTDYGRRFQTPENEAFWFSVLEWVARTPMLNPSQIAPMVDYIGFRRRQDAKFSMKGRTALALIRDTQEWHAELAKEKVLRGTAFKPSGFREIEIEKSQRLPSGAHETTRWNVFEILTSKDLAAEGRGMKHCVLSYAWSVEKGTTSIWSLTCNGQRALTIEVRNDTRRIVQARGVCNRPATSQEHSVLVQWAGQNNLEVALGRW